MASGYERIRNVALGAGALGAVMAGGVLDQAAALLVSEGFNVTTGGATYTDIETDNLTFDSFPTGAAEVDGLQISEATTAADSDAWDEALGLIVNNKGYQDSDGVFDVQTVPGIGTEVVGSGKAGGVSVKSVFRFFGDDSNVRALYTFSNRSKKARNLTIRTGTDHGQDGAADVDGSENGDTVVDPTDSWLTIGDESDVVSTHGLGEFTNNVVNFPDTGVSDDLVTQYNIRLKPRKSKTLALFIHLDDTVANGDNFGSNCLDDGADAENCDLFDGLSPAERSKIFNWDATP